MSAPDRYQVQSDPDSPVEFSRVVDTLRTLDDREAEKLQAVRWLPWHAHLVAGDLNTLWERADTADEGRAR